MSFDAIGFVQQPTELLQIINNNLNELRKVTLIFMGKVSGW